MTKKPNKKKTLPHNVSSEEFLQALESITRRLGHKFKFGYHDFDDMKQQAAIFALEGLKNYDSSRPLENFLWTHIRNRLFNYKRNNYQRPDQPCITCPLYDKALKCSINQCSKFTNKLDCELYSSWRLRNDSKKNIMKPTYIEQEVSSGEDLQFSIENIEILKFLDANIQAEFRESYLKLKHGDKIPKQNLTKLQNHIEILMKGFPCPTPPKNEDS